MKQDFDWRSEDDLYVEKKHDKPGNQPGFRFSKWLLIVLTALSIILGTLVIVQQLQKVVAQTASSTEDEVEQSLNFLLEAQELGDLELISSLISGRDAQWAEDQLLLMEERLFIDRMQFGLDLMGNSEPGPSIITISPDLNEVVLERTFSYKVKGASSDVDTVDLKQLFIFRMGRDRWLLSPPDRGFWGAESRIDGRYFTVIYPERDGEFIKRLAADLEGTVVAACPVLKALCTDQLNLTIQFSDDPQLIYRWGRPDHILISDQLIFLPTLSLFGRPTDDAGYRATFRLFSEILVRGLLDQQAQDACCNKPGFYTALSNELLNKLGFSEAGYGAEFQASQDLSFLFELWQRDADGEELKKSELREIQAFIKDVVEGLSADEISDIAQKMVRTEDFWGWLFEVNPSLLDSRRLPISSILSHI
ncbi:MAG: hypothetical protein BMS9Abin02_1954 [Anaerolineae bacterium]|nr:MAG: hypothetical protein BMS9Abin02_1954 [Anaerolineae bacterium]